MKHAALARVGVLALGCAAMACSHVRSVYVASPSVSPGEHEVKRIAVAGWAPADHPALETVLEAVAADYLKLRKNYLVQEGPAASMSRQGWQTLCQGKVEGVLLVRALSASLRGHAPADAALALSSELYRCHDGALMYRSEGALSVRDDDKSLRQMRAHYSQELGEAGGSYVPCAFSLLQELLRPMPDPTLTEAELEEKIELGARQTWPSETVAALP